MKDTLRQVTELAQQQRLLPQQLQFSRLLEMGEAELEVEIDNALNELPALEIEVDAAGEGTDFSETSDDLQRADYANEDEIPMWSRRKPDRMEDVTVEDAGMTLYELLNTQVSALQLDDINGAIAKEIIGNIDDNGYLTRSVSEIAFDLSVKLGIDVEETNVEEILHQVQQMDPKGVGARDLRECLLLQLGSRPIMSGQEVTIARKILNDDFELIVKNRWDTISRQYKLMPEEVDKIKALIRSLNPKPGAEVAENILESQGKIIVPELEVRVEDGVATVSMLSRLPELCVSKTFSLEGIKPGSAEEAFIKPRREEASGFIKILQMRREVLITVMEAIVNLQSEYFLTGDDSLLKPMVLKDVKELTGLDISVISRATSGRYVLTPWGVEPVKRFFSERSVVSDDGTEISGSNVALSIKRLIEEEDKSAPLSDSQIADILDREGMPVARRTVAKYRERLGFPVARLRK